MRDTAKRWLALLLLVALAWGGCCAIAELAQGYEALVDLRDATPEGEDAPLLAKGDRGAEVEALQARLIELGYLSGEADGIFGEGTQTAVRAFQAACLLEETGEVDLATLEALLAEDAPTPSPAPAIQAQENESSSEMVWIPNSGKRYHRNPNCSNMKNPTKVTVEEAIRRCFTPCKKCY